jgi:AcrR family transcriptional regulator
VTRTTLSREAILERALAVADAEGLEAVSIRRLSRELGVTPMALYWHFKDKRALLHALGDRLLADVDLTLDPAAAWPAQLHALFGSIIAVLRAHPSAATLIGALPTAASEHAQATTDVALDVLARAGFSPMEAKHVTVLLVRIATATIVPEHADPDEDPETLHGLALELMLAGVEAAASRRARGADPSPRRSR